MGLYAVLLNTRHPNSPDNSICLVCVSNSQDYGPVLKEISEPVRAQIDQLNAASTRFKVDFSAFKGTRCPVVARNNRISFSGYNKKFKIPTKPLMGCNAKSVGGGSQMSIF